MYVNGGKVKALAIIKDNNVLQTKYVAYILYGITLSSSSIGDSLHIVIENVAQNMGTSYNDADMQKESTTIAINDGSDSISYGTWTSTIVPENVTVELNCKVVEVNENTSVVTAKCYSETTWNESVFNRIPMWVTSNAQFGYNSFTNMAMFGTDSFLTEGSITQSWDGSTRYNVDGSGSNLTINDQFTIMGLPESFVSHWIDMGAKALMGNKRIMLVPPGSS